MYQFTDTGRFFNDSVLCSLQLNKQVVDLQDLQNIPAEIQSEKDEEKRLPEIDRMAEKDTLIEECWRGRLVAEGQMS